MSAKGLVPVTLRTFAALDTERMNASKNNNDKIPASSWAMALLILAVLFAMGFAAGRWPW